jgi:hypothetical protein
MLRSLPPFNEIEQTFRSVGVRYGCRSCVLLIKDEFEELAQITPTAFRNVPERAICHRACIKAPLFSRNERLL